MSYCRLKEEDVGEKSVGQVCCRILRLLRQFRAKAKQVTSRNNTPRFARTFSSGWVASCSVSDVGLLLESEKKVDNGWRIDALDKLKMSEDDESVSGAWVWAFQAQDIAKNNGVVVPGGTLGKQERPNTEALRRLIRQGGNDG